MTDLSGCEALHFSAYSGGAAAAVGAAGFIVVALGLFGAGRFLSRTAPDSFRQWPEALLTGALVWSQAIFLAAWAGIWSMEVGIALLGLGAVCGAFETRSVWRGGTAEGRWRRFWPLLPAAAALIVTLDAPTVFWDSRAYHLAIPEQIAARGALVADPSYVFAWYPQAMECLYVLALPFGDGAARLVNALFLVAAAAVAARAARSSLAALVFLAMPGVLMLAYVPKNIGLLALSGILALEHGLAATRDAAGRRHALFAGLAAGVGLATHYAGLWLVVFLLPMIAARAGARRAAGFQSVALAIAAPTYLRNAVAMRNPFYPFFSGIFGTPPPGSTAAASLPALDSLLRNLLIEPWTGLETLGIGSTLGLVAPIGLLLAVLQRRERPVAHLALRLGIGLGLLGVGIALYGFTRFGVAGLLFVLPVAARGLERRPLAACLGIAFYALFGALFLIDGPFEPLRARRDGAEAYREHFDAAWALAAVARALPPEARIASVGILRPQGWGARLEHAGEDYPPAIAAALATDDPAAALGRAGFTHLAIDDLELARLRRQYRYLVWDDAADSAFRALLDRSRRLATAHDRAALFELPR